MTKKRSPFLRILILALAAGLAGVLRAQEQPPAPRTDTPPPPEVATTPEPGPGEGGAPGDREMADSADAPVESPAAEPKGDEPELRELGAAEPEEGRRRHSTRRDGEVPFGNHSVSKGRRSGEVVSFLGSSLVDGETGEAVSIFGNTTVNGIVHGEAVAVMGSTTVNGTVHGEAVAVFGNNVITGTVRGDAVAVMGDMRLGPDAVVGGDVVVVGGRLIREPGSRIEGSIEEITLPIFEGFEWIHAYFHKCVKWGRLLWVGENLGWAWLVAGAFLVFYMLLALIFPSGIERCAAVLEEKPGSTILTAVLTALLTPVLMILLVMTGIGIALIPFLGAALFLCALFGKAAVLAWFGRRITGFFGEGPMRHAVAAVFYGGVMVCILYMLPVMGFLLHKLFGILGLGMVIYVLLLATRRERPAAAAAAVAAPGTGPGPAAFRAGAVPSSMGVSAEPAEAPPTAGAGLPPPVMISAATLPRVGFWLRLAAGLLDFLLIGLTTAMLGGMWFDFDGPGFLLFAYAAYSASMWKVKGTTIGGVICGLKVVRVDDRPLDWTIAIVRALAGFLSFGIAGLGFIWVAFDDEKQSWHDKIAGTTIVRVPKGISLL